MLLEQRRRGGARACLSTYPPDVNMYGTDAAEEPFTLCEAYWNERGLLVFRASVPLPPRPAPRPIGFAAAGFLFCPATILADVPFGARPASSGWGLELANSGDGLLCSGGESYIPSHHSGGRTLPCTGLHHE